MNLDWGNIPVWVGVLLTSVSIAIAARTYVTNSRRALREQASQVTVTLHQAQDSPDVLHTAVVTNNSKAPIWRVVLRIHRFTTTEASEREPVIPPDMSFSFTTEPFWYQKFAPGIASRLMELPPYCVVTFVDAQGYEWRRSSTGVLSPPPYPGNDQNWGGRWGARFRGLFYKFRKAVLPTRLRHWFRDHWRSYLSSRPKRYRGTEKDI